VHLLTDSVFKKGRDVSHQRRQN